MLFIAGVVTLLIAVAIVVEARMRRGASEGTLGQMSEQWLAEHRASHAA